MSLHTSQFSMTVWAPSGEVPPPVTPPVAHTMRFGAGTTGNSWYAVASISDSGQELRSKNVKAPHLTGKVTAAAMQIYAYDVTQAINVSDLEQGLNSVTGDISIPDTTEVTQTERYQVNVVNACLHTIRVHGTWDGSGQPDRLDEIVYELSVQGVRR